MARSVEANIALIAGLFLGVLAALAFTFPRGIAFPVGVFAAWLAVALLYRGLVLYRHGRAGENLPAGEEAVTGTERVPGMEQHPRPERK